ncbi:MAG: DUF2147 domain-containing protein [Gammaproteobacteria bacterium]|nr:DUF2147 domain-containing protein [Gammaproteobacteria bacterium]
MKKLLMGTALTFALALGSVSTAFAAGGPDGTWKRPDGSKAKVWMCGKKLCGKVISGEKKDFNMFGGGLTKQEDGAWKGGMKHPKMGENMNFNGTVKLASGKLSVKGCMLGGMMCDAETWTK